MAPSPSSPSEKRALYTRRLLVYRPPAADGYGSLQTLSDADSLAPLAAPNASIAVADLLP